MRFLMNTAAAMECGDEAKEGGSDADELTELSLERAITAREHYRIALMGKPRSHYDDNDDEEDSDSDDDDSDSDDEDHHRQFDSSPRQSREGYARPPQRARDPVSLAVRAAAYAVTHDALRRSEPAAAALLARLPHLQPSEGPAVATMCHGLLSFEAFRVRRATDAALGFARCCAPERRTNDIRR